MESLNDHEVQEITRAQYKAIVEIVNKNKHNLQFLEEKLLDYTKSIPNITGFYFVKENGVNKVKVTTADSMYYFKLVPFKKLNVPNEI